MSFGHPTPSSDLFGVAGRQRLERMALPEPWATSVAVGLELIDGLDHQIAAGSGAQQLDVSAGCWPPPSAAEIGAIGRFRAPKQLAGYTGLCPFVMQSGDRDRRGPLTKHGPRYLRWALIEAAVHAARHAAYRERYLRTRRRLGRQRGPRVAPVEVARQLATAIWHMLTKRQPFAPACPAAYLVAATTIS